MPLLWAGLFRKKTRTVLTLLSVFVAFLLFGLMQAVTTAFESGADSADAKRLLTIARYSIIELLPLSHLRQIEQVPGVVAVAHAEWFGAKYQNESNAFPVFAVEPLRYLDMYPEFTIAPAAAGGLRHARAPAPSRAQRLVERYGWKVGQKLPISSEIHPRADGSLNWEFDLVGTLDAEDPAVRANTDVVLINVAHFDEARRLGRGRTGWYIVRIDDSTRARAIAADIDRRFLNSPDETKTQPEKEFAVGFAKQIGDLGALVTRILAAVFFTILIMTGNTMAQSVRERIPELAILKTLGFSDGKVTALVLAEALLLLALAGGLGMLAAAGVLPGLNRRHRRALPAALRDRGHLAHRRGHRPRAGARRRAAARAPGPAAPHRRRAGGAPLTAHAPLHQIAGDHAPQPAHPAPARSGPRWSWSSGSPASSACWCPCSRCPRASATPWPAPAGPDRVILLRAGSDAELSSGVPRDAAALLATLPGVARDPAGRPLASAELVVMVDLPRQGETEPNNVPFRGVQPTAFDVRDEVRIVEGRPLPARPPRGDRRPEGGAAVRRARRRAPGSPSGTATGRWSATSRAAETCTSRRSGATPRSPCRPSGAQGYQSVTAQLGDGSAAGLRAFRDSISRDPRFSITVLQEPEYYAKQATVLSNLINVLGYTVAGFMAIGATFGALNCMYSAIASRQVEIATLRAIGFGNLPVVVSVLIEALVLAVVGGALGGALAYLYCDGFSLSTLNFNTFSQVAFDFRVTPGLLAQGFAWALAIGVAGGLLPAVRAARLPVTAALRAG